MKWLLAMAVVVLASSAAQAQYQFEYGGKTIRIDPDRGTIQIPGVYDNTGKKSKRAKGDTDSSRNKPASQDANQQPATPPAPADAAAAPPPPAPAPAAPPAPAAATASPAPAAEPPTTTTANNAPADTPAATQRPPAPPAPAPLPPLQQDVTTPRAPAPPPPPTVAAVPPPAPSPPAQTQAPQPADPNSPVGVWLTEEKEGKVRIQPCGANLCGYAVDAKSNANGEQVLINMKPGQAKWSGRILDPNTGSTYDSTIALKGPDTLRVQGCAFGGMFCGGQTWTRVN
jgi:uncharacterized protein (DUF2147 family)